MDESTHQLFASTLQKHGYSYTKPRQLVFELLWGQEPQSVPDLLARLHGAIDRASLYRCIEVFERAGITQRIHVGWKYNIELTPTFSYHHHHISCLNCGKVTPIEQEDEVERLIHAIADRYHVVAKTHQLEIQGVCETCQNNSWSG